MFDKAFETFLAEQQRSASGQRLEMLHRDLTGTKKLIEVALWPVLKSLEGLVLEYEMMSLTGMRVYGDVYWGQLDTVIESNGYVPHAENITRDRFSFEQMRIRTVAMYGHRYVPFSWDELDKRPEACRRTLYELIGRFGSRESKTRELSLLEREIIRYVLLLNRPFRFADICNGLQVGSDAARRALRRLLEKRVIRPLDADKKRHHRFVLEGHAKSYLLQ